MNLAPIAISTLLAASLAACATTDAGDDDAVSSWRDAITATGNDDGGCAHASYPDMTWESTDCAAAPNRPFSARRNNTVPFTVGNGADYALQVSGLIAKTSGSFLKLKNVKTERDSTANTYSIQLNSNFMSGTAACNGVSGCMSWAQFVYSTAEESAFIQNWLIGIGTCPSGDWNDDGQGDCFINSAAVTVPSIPITDLGQLKMTGGSVAGGKDSLLFAFGTEAFRTSEKDNVTDLASAWTASEFNIVGDGGASEAVFNTGASVTVLVGVSDHSTAAPQCVANDGTTGETNNLTLGACKTVSGSEPKIEFTESN